MVKCPRCEFPVDETTRTTCPLCFTPLGAAEEGQAPAPPQAAATPEQQSPVPVAQPVAAPLPTIPMMPPPSVPMPLQQQIPTPQQGYAPQPPQAQQMPGMYQAQQSGGEMPQAVPQQPQYTPGSAPRPGVRVSLTGEVIDDSMGSAPPPPNYVGGAMPPPRPAGPAGASAARRPMREEAPDASKGSPAAAITLVVMLLVGMGFGGWWFLSHRTNPKDQTTKFFTALQQQDWKTMYTVIDLSDEDRKRLPDADAYEKEAKEKIASNPFGSQMLSGLKNIKFTAGEAKFEGDTATVPVTLKVNMQGQEQSVNMPVELVNKGGWKVKPGGIGGGMMGGAGGGGMMTR